MNRGPVSGRGAGLESAAERARAAFDGLPPDWIAELASACDATSQTAVARRVGYSASVISLVIRGRYPGDLAAVEDRVRGALLGATVGCPVLGEIGRHRCLDEQKKSFLGTSSIRTRLFHACRSGCPHSRLTKETDHVE